MRKIKQIVLHPIGLPVVIMVIALHILVNQLIGIAIEVDKVGLDNIIEDIRTAD
tara:strand:+ start:2475 stop:2636 length:162 start_codon:yes stop_codon:yes gene_type:complete